MANALRPILHIADTPEAVIDKLAHFIRSTADAAVARHVRFDIALSGGQTPGALYTLLAERHAEAMPWQQTHFFFGDERYVPHDDPQSNARMAAEAMLDRVPTPREQIHPMPTHHADPTDAADEYEACLRQHFSSRPPHFDLILLGIGPDGHTASLFPNSPVLDERVRWVVPAKGPTEPRLRLTFTYPVLNAAHVIAFLALGADKTAPVGAALSYHPDRHTTPAAGVRPTDGEVFWWLDGKAAEKL